MIGQWDLTPLSARSYNSEPVPASVLHAPTNARQNRTAVCGGTVFVKNALKTLVKNFSPGVLPSITVQLIPNVFRPSQITKGRLAEVC